MRKYLRWGWIYFLYCTGLLSWARARITAQAGIVVLTLHRVLEAADFQKTNSPRGMVLRSITFDRLIQFLRKNGDVLALDDGPPTWNKQDSRPRFAITFDDGWKDTSDVAFPIAEKYEAPIAVFICPGLVSETAPFWPEHIVRIWRFVNSDRRLKEKFAEICTNEGVPLLPGSGTNCLEALLSRLKELAPGVRERISRQLRMLAEENWNGTPIPEVDATMPWEHIKRLASVGVSIGSHTSSHPILPSLPASEAEAEIRSAKSAIELELHQECKLFAYPNGAWSPHIRELVEKEKHTQAFTADVGVWMESTDPLLIPRVNIWEGSIVGPSGRFSPAVFSYALFWRSYRAEARARSKKERSSYQN